VFDTSELVSTVAELYAKCRALFPFSIVQLSAIVRCLTTSVKAVVTPVTSCDCVDSIVLIKSDYMPEMCRRTDLFGSCERWQRG
jgi:hypothetical protein